jgi:RNA polymerase sigma-70 factor, ECF subfamily
MLRIVRPSEAPEGDPAAEDCRLVAGLRAGEVWATTALVERHGNHVRRVLMRLLGSSDGGAEQADIFQDVITAAWEGIDRLHDPAALRAWLTRIAVFTARKVLRTRRRRRWLAFLDEVPDVPATWAGPELREAARAVYDVLDRMPVDERIPFTLRMLEKLDLEETARACEMSLATVRRRLVRAERRFRKLARQYEALGPWLAHPVAPDRPGRAGKTADAARAARTGGEG